MKRAIAAAQWNTLYLVVNGGAIFFEAFDVEPVDVHRRRVKSHQV